MSDRQPVVLPDYVLHLVEMLGELDPDDREWQAVRTMVAWQRAGEPVYPEDAIAWGLDLSKWNPPAPVTDVPKQVGGNLNPMRFAGMAMGPPWTEKDKAEMRRRFGAGGSHD